MATKTTAAPKTEKVKVTYAAPTVDEKAIVKKSTDLSDEITALVVKDQATYTLAGQSRAKLQEYIEWLGNFYGPSKKALNAAVTTIRNEEKRVIGPRMTFAEKLLEDLNTKMSNFLLEDDKRIRREAAEEKARQDKEAAKLLARAEKAEDKGKDDKAETLREQAAAVAAAPIEIKKAVTFSGTGTWAKDDISVEVLDSRAFMEHLFSAKVDISTLIEWKVKNLKDYVKKFSIPQGKDVQEVPGLKIEKKKIIAG